MNQPWIYMCSPSRSPLSPPSPPDPSGSSQCTRSEHLSYASNLGWWSVSPLIIPYPVILCNIFWVRVHSRWTHLAWKPWSTFYQIGHILPTMKLTKWTFSSVTQPCPTLWNPMNCSTPGLLVHHQLPESTQTHVHCVSDAIQPSHPLSSPSPPFLNLYQHQGLFK